jgi:transposase
MSKDATYIVRLTEDERLQLRALISTGQRAAAVLARARILLKADAGPRGLGLSDEAVAQAVESSESTVHRVRQAFVEEGWDAALFRKKPTGRQYRKLDGAQEARLVALACSQPPSGRAHWTLKLLAEHLVRLEVVDSISPECVRLTLKRTTSNSGFKSNG